MSVDISNKKHIQLALRRGMLELDILLNRFFVASFDSLSEKDKQDFMRLLEAPDPELFAWLMGHQAPTDTSFKDLIAKIRHCK